MTMLVLLTTGMLMPSLSQPPYLLPRLGLRNAFSVTMVDTDKESQLQAETKRIVS